MLYENTIQKLKEEIINIKIIYHIGSSIVIFCGCNGFAPLNRIYKKSRIIAWTSYTYLCTLYIRISDILKFFFLYSVVLNISNHN